jgi:hypothetical protein
VLQQLVPQHYEDFNDIYHKNAQRFQTLYIIGDNPAVDIRGAQQVYLLELEFTSTMVGSIFCQQILLMKMLHFRLGILGFLFLRELVFSRGRKIMKNFQQIW